VQAARALALLRGDDLVDRVLEAVQPATTVRLAEAA
jgi:hypothetical protein